MCSGDEDFIGSGQSQGVGEHRTPPPHCEFTLRKGLGKCREDAVLSVTSNLDIRVTSKYCRRHARMVEGWLLKRRVSVTVVAL